MKQSDRQGYFICSKAFKTAVKNSLYLESILTRHNKAYFDISKEISANQKSLVLAKAKTLNSLLVRYITKAFQKEVLSIMFKSLVSFNKAKFEKQYALPLANQLSMLYDKPVSFNFIKVRYPYMNSSIFAQTLAVKITNRKNNLLHVLNNSLEMLKLPDVNNLQIYNDIYNRKMILQNPSISNVSIKPFVRAKTASFLNLSTTNDLIDPLLSTTIANYDKSLISEVFNKLHDKHVKGIRIEVSGRLTKRYTASRSVSKLKYKGNIKDNDSSIKGLSSVLLRGMAKPNVSYSFTSSKVRTGSFGVKG